MLQTLHSSDTLIYTSWESGLLDIEMLGSCRDNRSKCCCSFFPGYSLSAAAAADSETTANLAHSSPVVATLVTWAVGWQQSLTQPTASSRLLYVSVLLCPNWHQKMTEKLIWLLLSWQKLCLPSARGFVSDGGLSLQGQLSHLVQCQVCPRE